MRLKSTSETRDGLYKKINVHLFAESARCRASRTAPAQNRSFCYFFCGDVLGSLYSYPGGGVVPSNKVLVSMLFLKIIRKERYR